MSKALDRIQVIAQTAQEQEYGGHDQLVAMRAARNYNTMIERLIDRWLWDCPSCLVDIGAGMGEFAVRMKNRGHCVLAVEPDSAQRDHVRGLGIETVKRVQDIPYQVYGAYSLNVLEHIEDDVQALREWAQLLHAGGMLFLYVPAFPALYSSMDKTVGHYRRYTRASLEQAVRQAGLQVVRSGYADSLGFPASLMLRLRGTQWKGDITPSQVRLYDQIVFPISKALDTVVSPLFGKNVWLTAKKEGS